MGALAPSPLAGCSAGVAVACSSCSQNPHVRRSSLRQAPADRHFPDENIYDPAIKAGLPGRREGRADWTSRRFQNVHAQGGHAPGSLKVTRLTSDDGLSQNRIYAILQDRRGFMWFATQDGLNRYDGNTFVVYQHNPDDPNTLSTSLDSESD